MSQTQEASDNSSGLTFLLMGTEKPKAPALGAHRFVVDIDADFDAVIVLGSLTDKMTASLMASHNPLAALIAGPSTTLPYADHALSELSAAALDDAQHKIQPIIKTVATLPTIPVGPDRDSLIAVGRAHSRGLDIRAGWAPNHAGMVSYPLLWPLAHPRETLEDLADAKLLGRSFFERLHVCTRCSSSRMVARETCNECGSSHLSESQLIHHYKCGNQAPQSTFMGEPGAGLTCPKCQHGLRHYGVDYDKPGLIISCESCSTHMTDPAVGFLCADCGTETSGNMIDHLDWYHYKALPDAITALRAGRMAHRDLSGALASLDAVYAMRDFRILLDQMLPIAKRYSRPLTAWKLQIDPDAVNAQLGPQGARQVYQLTREIIAQSLRTSDFAALLPHGIVACLPETPLAGADIVINRLRKVISDTFSVAVSFEFSVFDVTKAQDLLEELA